MKLKWKLGNEEGGPRSSSQQRERERERERERNMGERKRPDPRESGVQRSICFSSLWCISPCGVWGLQNFKENIGKVMFSFSKVQVKTPPREL